MIGITVMLKNGGYDVIKISSNMLGQLALAIKQKGSEIVHLTSGSIEVVGIIVIGNQAGDRVILLGAKDGESHE